MFKTLDSLLYDIQDKVGLAPYAITCYDALCLYEKTKLHAYTECMALVNPELNKRIEFDIHIYIEQIKADRGLKRKSVRRQFCLDLGLEFTFAEEFLWVCLHELGHVEQVVKFHRKGLLYKFIKMRSESHELINGLYGPDDRSPWLEQDPLGLDLQLNFEELYAEQFVMRNFLRVRNQTIRHIDGWLSIYRNQPTIKDLADELEVYVRDLRPNVERERNSTLFNLNSGTLELKGTVLNPEYYINGVHLVKFKELPDVFKSLPQVVSKDNPIKSLKNML